jgi:hypothetical protein
MAGTLDALKTKRLKDADNERRKAHANTQFKYRDRKRRRNSPDREDFGRAALTVVLLLSRDLENREFAEAVRRSVTSRLTYVGFDHTEVEAVFSRMMTRISDDAEAWKCYKEWQSRKSNQGMDDHEEITG